MGQSVSMDAELWDLRGLLRLVEIENMPASGGARLPLKQAAARHHLKVWQFQQRGRAVVDSPVALCDKRGALSVEIQRNCSYLLLHVWAVGAAEPPGAAAVEVCEDLAARAGAAFTPRGLAASPIISTNCPDPTAGPTLCHAIFVWHGLDVVNTVKARAFARAFELDGAISDGLLRQPSFLESLASAVVLRGTAGKACSQSHEDRIKCGHVQLLLGMQGMAPAVGGGGGRSRSSRVGGAACHHHFPRVGKEVRRSLDLGQGTALSAAPVPGSARYPVVPRLALNPTRAAEAVPVSGTERQGPDEALMQVDNNTLAAGSLEAGAACSDSARKRLRGGPKGAPPCQAAGPASLLCPTARGELPVGPKSARIGESCALQSPRKEPGLQPRVPVPALNLMPPRSTPGHLACADRSDAPTMLNLEEINMSEEDLIRSYDPTNEENNYHLPDHLYKALQLKQYRQACSEVIPNEVYIGGFQVASDLEALQRNQITHIVNMAADVCDSSFPEHFSYLTYYLKDTNSEDLSPYFYRTLDWMRSAVDGGGHVLVHCREGVSRSATMAIAYLMWKQSLSFEAAHEKLRKARPICNPNTGFTCQLLMLGRRLGVSGHGGQALTAAPVVNRPQLFHVAPHHANEPFLMLWPSEWPQSWPHFDPRFGWVVQRCAQIILWLGSQMPDPESAQAVVRHHTRLVEVFERRSLTLTIMSEGEELPLLWSTISTTPDAAPPDGFGLSCPNPSLDAEYEVMRRLAAGRARAEAAEEPAPRSAA